MRKEHEQIAKRNMQANAEPFWHDYNQTITDICKQKEAGRGKNGMRNQAKYQSMTRDHTKGIAGIKNQQKSQQQHTRNMSQSIQPPITQGTDAGTIERESTAAKHTGNGD